MREQSAKPVDHFNEVHRAWNRDYLNRMFPDVIVNSMRFLVIAAIVLADVSLADPDFQGVKCGEKHCNASEYCSDFDMHCRPCAVVCDKNSHNYQLEECIKACQGE